MSESFDLAPERFTAGAVGPKGRRVFYLQAAGEGAVVTLKLEKQQVGALADYLEQLLEDLPAATDHERPAGTAMGLREPLDAAWVVGGLGVAYDERDDRVVLVAEELVAGGEDDDATDDEDEDEDWLDADDDDDGPAVARFRLRRAQVQAFIEHARTVVAAGRPTCRRCGRPLEPFLCPCYN